MVEGGKQRSVRQKIRPEPKIVDLTGYPAEYHARTDKFRPLIAGIGIQSATLSGTAGLCCFTSTGANAIITSAHVFSGDDMALGQYLFSDLIGACVAKAPPYSEANVDVALVAVPGIGIELWEVQGDAIAYTIESSSNYGDAGDEVQIEGLESGTSKGNIVHPAATISVEGQKEYAGVADYLSQPGDSGAPVIWWDGSESTFIGIHGGRVQIEGAWKSWYVPYGAFLDFMRV